MMDNDGAMPPTLFSDDFDDGLLSDELEYWRMQFQETLHETGGQLEVVSAARPGFNYGHWGNGRTAEIATHIGDPDWTDYRIEMRVEARAVGDFNPHGISSCFRAFGVGFRAEDRQESWNAPEKTGYQLSIGTADCDGCSQQGSYGLSKSRGEWMEGTGFE